MSQDTVTMTIEELDELLRFRDKLTRAESAPPSRGYKSAPADAKTAFNDQFGKLTGLSPKE